MPGEWEGIEFQFKKGKDKSTSLNQPLTTVTKLYLLLARTCLLYVYAVSYSYAQIIIFVIIINKKHLTSYAQRDSTASPHLSTEFRS